MPRTKLADPSTCGIVEDEGGYKPDDVSKYANINYMKHATCPILCNQIGKMPGSGVFGGVEQQAGAKGDMGAAVDSGVAATTREILQEVIWHRYMGRKGRYRQQRPAVFGVLGWRLSYRINGRIFKKTSKTPRREIETAMNRRRDNFSRKGK